MSWVAEKRKQELLEKKKEVLIKVSFSVRWGSGCLKRALNFYIPFSIHFAATYRLYRGQQRANYLCNIATLSTLKPLGTQGRGVGAIPGRFF